MSKWYVYDDDEVIGPFATDELVGQIESETLVCPAGSEEWKKAEEIEALQEFFGKPQAPPSAPPGEQVKETEQTEAESDQAPGEPEKPTLNKLNAICQQATDDELTREYEKFWEEYDSPEQRIIRNEMVTRDLWEEVTATEEEDSEMPV